MKKQHGACLLKFPVSVMIRIFSVIVEAGKQIQNLLKLLETGNSEQDTALLHYVG